MPRPPKPPATPESGEYSPRLAFARVLRRRRLDLGLRQTDLEGEGVMDASYISKLELGKSQVCLDGFIFLAGRLNILPSELMKEVEEEIGRSR